MAGLNAPVMATDEKEILIVGSSRVHQLTWKKLPGYHVHLFSMGGLQHEDLLRIAQDNISSKTAILILVGLQVELHSRTRDRRGKAGLIYANPTPPINEIVTRLSCADYGWKTRGITTVWVAPYTPNLVLLNANRKRANNWGHSLMPYEIEMAEHFMEVIGGNRVNLIQKMRLHNLEVLELQLRPWHLTKAAGSDGLHLGYAHKRELFGHIIDDAIKMHQAGPPKPQIIELPLKPELRQAVNDVRKQKRKMRRTRAAERQIFETVAKEKALSQEKLQTSEQYGNNEPKLKKQKIA